MPREISDAAVKLFENLCNEKITLIKAYPIPEAEKDCLRDQYIKALNEMKSNNLSSAATQLSQIKTKRQEEDERNRTKIVYTSVPTVTVKEGSNLIVKPKDEPLDPKVQAKLQLKTLLSKYTKQQLELDWPHSFEKSRPVYKGILYHAQTLTTMKEIHETMYPTTESTYIMTYSNLVCFYRQLMDRGYIQQKENKYSPLKLTEMGKAVLEYADIKKLTE